MPSLKRLAKSSRSRMRATVYLRAEPDQRPSHCSGSSHSLLKRTSVFSGIQDLEDLRLVGFGVALDALRASSAGG